MITRAEVEKLGAMHTVEPTVLSLYLAVPPQPAPLSLLAARADELIAAAEAACGAGQQAGQQERNAVRETLARCGRNSPGRMVAIFACADAGLLEALPVPGPVPSRFPACCGSRRYWASGRISGRCWPPCSNARSKAPGG